MAKRKKITVSLYIGKKPVDKLPPEYVEKICQKFSEVFSRYYSDHPDEWEKIKDTLPDAPPDFVM